MYHMGAARLAGMPPGMARRSGRMAAADLELTVAQGEPRWVHCMLSAAGHDDRDVGVIEGVLYDITARLKRENDAIVLSERDPLTGLPNRRGTEVSVDRTLRGLRDAGDTQNLAVVMIDVDGFKAVNDAFGHGTGDDVLIVVANRLKGIVRRSSDLVGRWGGDEFIVAFSYEPQHDNRVERICIDVVTALSRPIVLDAERTINVGASVGVARFPADGTGRNDLFAAADRAMYAVKKAGKNGYAFAAAPREIRHVPPAGPAAL